MRERVRGRRWWVWVVPLVAGAVGAALFGIVMSSDDDDAADVVAQRHLDEISSLAAQPFDKEPAAMLAWEQALVDHLVAIDADAEVADRFADLVDARGDASRAPGADVRLIAAVDDDRTRLGDLLAQADRSPSWQHVRDTVSGNLDSLTDRLTALLAGLARQAAYDVYVTDPQGWELGANPVLQAMEARDYRAAYRISDPASASDCPAGYVFGGGACAADLAGMWRGRYTGSLTYEGATCAISGAVTTTITQQGSTISGTVALAASMVAFDTCTQFGNEQYPFRGMTVQGLSAGDGTLQLFRRSPNALTAVFHGPLGDISFDGMRAATP